jgi:hypothetical protein
MKLVYVNADAPVRDIVIPGGFLTVTAGEPFDVPDHLAASLLEQSIFAKAPKADPKEQS